MHDLMTELHGNRTKAVGLERQPSSQIPTVLRETAQLLDTHCSHSGPGFGSQHPYDVAHQHLQLQFQGTQYSLLTTKDTCTLVVHVHIFRYSCMHIYSDIHVCTQNKQVSRTTTAVRNFYTAFSAVARSVLAGVQNCWAIDKLLGWGGH